MNFALILVIGSVMGRDLKKECGKYFNPLNYMDQLPSLSLPYMSNVPFDPPIKPSPVITTKVLNIVTKYVYRNPICVKITGKKKSSCQQINNNHNNVEYLVTKEYFVKGRRGKSVEDNDLGLYIQSSEEPRPFSKIETSKTPSLSSEQVKEMLIEDRLDQLETILPQYTRKRVYQTSTLTVTRVRSNNRATATLLAKNCVPQGYELCPQKAKGRDSKIARFSNATSRDNIERQYFG